MIKLQIMERKEGDRELGRWKSWIGVLLIVLSVIGLVFWELQGRESFLMKPILVAAEELPAGTVVSAQSFTVVRVPENVILEGALSAEAAASLYGKSLREKVAKNQQISEHCFMEAGQVIKKEESIFVLPGEWLAMRSSSLRRGDWIRLYGASTLSEIGVYRIAFAKDQTEQEVVDAQGGLPVNILDRTTGTGQINGLEIIATLPEYGNIRAAAASEGGLLAVQEAFSGGDAP